MATTKVPSHQGHKVLPTCGPETDFGTQIQQKKNIMATRVDKLFLICGLETNYFLRMASADWNP